MQFCDKIDWQYIVKQDHAGQDQDQKAPRPRLNITGV